MEYEEMEKSVHRRISICSKLLKVKFWIIPNYKAYCNTFIGQDILYATIKLIMFNGLQTILFHVRMSILVQDDEHCIDMKCFRHFCNLDPIVYILSVNVLLCLPATKYEMFQLYKSPEKKLNDSMGMQQCKTWFLAFCEVVGILYAFALVYLGVELIYSLGVGGNCVYHERGEPYRENVEVLVALTAVELVCRIVANYLCWMQIFGFIQLRIHASLQRGVYGANRVCNNDFDAGRVFMSKKNKEISRINTLFYTAVRCNQIDLLYYALEQAVQLDGPNFHVKWYRCTLRYFKFLTFAAHNPLHYACMAGRYNMVNEFLNAGFCVNQLDKVLWNSLRLSDFFTKLTHAFGIIRKHDFTYNETTMHSQVGQGDWLTCTLLAPLHVACAYSHSDIVKLLINHGADVNLVPPSNLARERLPPIYWTKSCECVNIVMKAGANHLHVPGNGYYLTPYQFALLKERGDVAALIKQYGGDIALSPLHKFAAVGNLMKMERLLELGTNPNILADNYCDGEFHRSPIFGAAMRGQVEAIYLLHQFGADINLQDSQGCTALSWACYHNQASAVKTLLNLGAVPHIDYKGRTCAIFCAQVEGIQESIFLMLRNAGVNLDEEDQFCADTALHVSIRNAHEKTSVALIRAGASLSYQNSHGVRALDMTCSSSLQYAIKKQAGRCDVMISYSHQQSEFAERVRLALNNHRITTWFDQDSNSGMGIAPGSEWREELGRGIHQASAMLSIISDSYQRSQWCMKEVALAKQYGVPVIAISCEANLLISDELKLCIYTRQILDFSNKEDFDANAVLLIDGIRTEIEVQRQTSLRRPADFTTTETSSVISSPSSRTSYVSEVNDDVQFYYITHGDKHPAFARRIKRSLQSLGFTCIIDSPLSTRFIRSSQRTRMGVAKDSILKCKGLIVLLSRASTGTELLSDQLAFAEDQHIRIYPVIYSNPDLTLGQQYTFGLTTNVYHFTENLGYQQSLHSLADDLTTTESIETAFQPNHFKTILLS